MGSEAARIAPNDPEALKNSRRNGTREREEKIHTRKKQDAVLQPSWRARLLTGRDARKQTSLVGLGRRANGRRAWSAGRVVLLS